MIEISLQNPDKSILAFVKQWIALLAEGRAEDAGALIDEPNCYGILWTPKLINEVINSTFSCDSRFYKTHPEGPIITDPFQLKEQRETEVIELENDRGYAFDYNLPLNGEWSDLTAQFEFHKKPNGYSIVLHDIHVL
jgi:hypothetical protein